MLSLSERKWLRVELRKLKNKLELNKIAPQYIQILSRIADFLDLMMGLEKLIYWLHHGFMQKNYAVKYHLEMLYHLVKEGILPDTDPSILPQLERMHDMLLPDQCLPKIQPTIEDGEPVENEESDEQEAGNEKDKFKRELRRLQASLRHDSICDDESPVLTLLIVEKLVYLIEKEELPEWCTYNGTKKQIEKLQTLLKDSVPPRCDPVLLQKLQKLKDALQEDMSLKNFDLSSFKVDDDDDDAEDDWVDLNHPRREELRKVHKAYEIVAQSIVNQVVNSNKKNPLYEMRKELFNLGEVLLEFERITNKPPEYVITRALRNGARYQPNQEVERVGKDQEVAKVKPNPRKKDEITSAVNEVTEKVVNHYYPNKIAPDPMILGSYAPVRTETTPSVKVKKVKGRIPVTLTGMMIRNGPNPVFDPRAHYKWLDGDSMVHAISFKNGEATYTSHYVKTSRYKQEQYFGKPQFLQYGDLHGEFGYFMACMQLLKEVFGVLDMSYGWSNANTGVVNHNAKLMILQDWDNPYVVNALENGELDTLGINDYNKKLIHSFTPHPKKDPITGELFILGTSYTPPYAYLTIVSKNGDVSDPMDIDILAPTYNHDFGLTQNYVILMDLPYCFNPKKMLEQGTWIYSFDKRKSRFGVLPRYAKNKDEIIWIDFEETFFIFHIGNCWEEDEDNIVMICCVLEPKIIKVDEDKAEEVAENKNPANRKDNPFSALSQDASNKLYEITSKPPHVFAGRNTTESFTETYLYKFILNKKTQVGHKYKISPTHLEYPKVNENYIGRKTKYMYLSEMNSEFKIPSIAKYNLEWETEIKLYFGEKEFGSEVAYVPRHFAIPLEEDDGYLTTFVHDEQNSMSFAYVISAKRMEFLAKISLPNKVPYGFHATFVPEDELRKIKNATV